MKPNTSRQSFISPKIMLAASIIVSAYWVLGNFINIYSTKFGGAIYEILWLPMLLLLFATPAACVLFLAKNHFKFNPYYLFALLINTVALAIIILKK